MLTGEMSCDASPTMEAARRSVQGLEGIVREAARQGLDVHVGPIYIKDQQDTAHRSYVLHAAFDYIVHEPGSSVTPKGWTTYRSSLLQNHPLVVDHAPR